MKYSLFMIVFLNVIVEGWNFETWNNNRFYIDGQHVLRPFYMQTANGCALCGGSSQELRFKKKKEVICFLLRPNSFHIIWKFKIFPQGIYGEIKTKELGILTYGCEKERY